ncbi:MAG: protein kinase [Gemmatimonadetes bacterium]|nr:protein kinase [Gemmatimonadota bacterium]
MFTTEQLNTALDGRYAIERRIGEGGMAIVYLARDLRHDRRVALKVLRPDLGAIVGEERFLAEIRVTANLQHPNLLPLFDSGAADGVLFYVMPYVEGESLRARIDREKQLPVDEAIRITVAIAGALDHAHKQGIIHRDLKPENILLQAGQPVIADFGIALAVSNAGGARITQTGLSLGTPMYMSPEQATGDRSIDGRTDLYSLAAMTYEMLTGEPPHTGTTSQAIIAKLMTENPRPLTTLRRSVPPHVNAAVLQALEKVPADRFATPHEFATALTTPGAMLTTPAPATDAPVAAARPASSIRLLVAGLAGAALTAVGAALWITATKVTPPVTRVSLAFPEQARPSERTKYALSADGSTLAYRADDSTAAGVFPAQLWIKARAQATPRLLIPRLVTSFALSSDGSWLAYVEGSRLFQISTTGGAGVPLADSVTTVTGFGDDGAIYFWKAVRQGTVNRGHFLRVALGGGPATELTTMPDTLQPIDGGTLLPGGKGLIVGHCGRGGACPEGGVLFVLVTATGEARPLLPGAIAGWYLSTGDLLALRRDGMLVRVPFDLATMTVRGNPAPVLDSVGMFMGGSGRPIPQIAFSREGTVVATIGPNMLVSGLGGFHRMLWVDRTGKVTPVDTAWTFRLTQSSSNIGWAISPNGRRVAIGENRQLTDNIWIKELKANGIETRLTTDSASEYRPRWTPDGTAITFHRSTGLQSLFRRRADGTGTETLLVPPARLAVAEHAWAPDGKSYVFRRGGSGDIVGGRDIWLKGAGADTTSKPIVADPKFDEAAMSISPDGRWIAFESNETGVREVYVRPFPNTDAGKWKVSNGGAHAALWAKNGRELYFVTLQRDMMAAPLRPTPTQPGLGTPVKLFHLPDTWALRDDENYTPFDVAADGRFLMAERVTAREQTTAVKRRPVLYIEHWLGELARMGKVTP